MSNSLIFILSLICIQLIGSTPVYIEDKTNIFPPSKGNDTRPQLQPGKYDNTKFGIPNFFEHEIIYVENSLVLVWRPIIGKWQLHKVNRHCGSECAIVNEDPIAYGFWPERKFHKLTFMGCHKTTGFGHMLEVDPATGDYWVVLFDHNQLMNPLTEIVAHFRRLDMTQYKIVYTGRDEVLLYDGNSDKFKIYLVEPRLPLSNGEDPIGPFEALDEGVYPLHEQLIYLGNDVVMDYSAVTGEYSIYSYDRGASLHESPFKNVTEEGNLGKGFQLTYLTENQVLVLDPNTGLFKSFLVENGVKFTNEKKVDFFGFGTLIEADLCSDKRDCSKCIAKDGCGWCEKAHSCLRGGDFGPCTTNCTGWEMNVCPGLPCNTHVGCSACLADPFCGWCSDSNTCTEGSMSGPLFGSCAFSKVECPVYNPEIIAVAPPCEEEIQ